MAPSVLTSHAYRMAQRGEFPGAFKCGEKWLVATRKLDEILGKDTPEK